MRVLSILALLAAGVLVIPASAEEKKAKAPTGTYTRKAGDLDLKVVWKKESVMEFHVTVGDAGCVMTSKYTMEKDGVFKCEVTEFEKKGDFPAVKEKGYKFSFKLEMKDKKFVMSDLTGDDITADQKQAVEGEYDQASD